MISEILFAAAQCGKNCPPHAIAALAGTAAVAFTAGFLIGRKSGAPKKPSAKRMPAARRPADRPAEPRQPIPSGSVEIYVGNLSYDLTEDGLRKAFEAYGAVHSARVVTNRYNNRSKGFGFVVMPNRAEAEKAIAEMNDRDGLGRKMRVNEAQNTVKADA